MNQDLLQRAARRNRINEGKSRINRATRVLSLMIAFVTVYSLMMPAITINNDPVCGLEEHKHTNECFELRPVQICGREAEEAHVHTDACYTAEEGYICGLTETQPHVHTESCYSKQNVLSCGLPESEGHKHSDGCYELACVCAVTDENHTHDSACYERRLVCTQEERNPHRHSEACYTEEDILNCTLSTEGHVHTPACLGPIKTLICGREESEGHTHTEVCYEDREVPICGMEEHEHTAACYPEASDDTADLETREMWEASLSHIQLTGNWADDLLAVAVSQLGYTESSANFRYVGIEKKGYSRYGEWYGDPYGDWCAMFVSFCLHYAGIDNTVFPYEENCAKWAEKLAAMNMYAALESGAGLKKGDIVFFDVDDNFIPDHLGIIADFNETTGKLTTIEGNLNNRVDLHEFFIYDPAVFGFGILPENPELSGEDTDESGEEPGDEPENEPSDETEDEPGNESGDIPGDETENEPEKNEAQGSCGEKLLNTARSLVGMTEGINSELVTGDIKAVFIAYCVQAAELSDRIPCYENCALWANELARQGRLLAADGGYIPALGDLVFFDSDFDAAADSIGIVSDADAATEALVTVESDAAAQVSYHFHKLSDAEVLGYYSLTGSTVIAENKVQEEEIKEETEEKTEEETGEETIISAVSEDGVTVTVKGQLPENAQIVLTPVSEEELAEIMASVEEGTPLFAYDITIIDNEGQKWQPDELGVSVSITGLSIPEDSETEVVHVLDEGEITSMEAESSSDTVEFSTKSFSVYIIYTVDFNYEDLSYSIQGEDSILLSVLFEKLGIRKKAANVISTEFSSPEFLSVEKTEEDWLLTSLLPFDTEEELTLVFTDGTEITIKVTDKRTVGVMTEKKAIVNIELKWEETTPEGTSVTATLYENETATENTLTLSSENGWKGSFRNLDAGKSYSVEYTPIDGYNYIETNEKISTEWSESAALESGGIYLLAFEDNSVVMNSVNVLSVGEITVSDTEGICGVSDAMKWSYDGISLKNSGKALEIAVPAEETIDIPAVLYTEGHLSQDGKYLKVSEGVFSSVDTAEEATEFTLYGNIPAEIINFTVSVRPRVRGVGGTPYTAAMLPHNKMIDYLDDGDVNPDTTVKGDDLYRLYLDVNGMIDPVDMLIVIDGSGSMHDSDKMDVNNTYRDSAIQTFLNGTKNNSDTSLMKRNGFISYFLGLNPENQISVIQFYGMAHTDSGGTKSDEKYKLNSHNISRGTISYTDDSKVILPWTDAGGYTAQKSYLANEKNGTDYEAGLILADLMFDDKKVVSNGHKKLMIFMSDGAPTFFLINESDYNTKFGDYTMTQANDAGHRAGTGSENTTKDKNGDKCDGPSRTAFNEFHNKNTDVTVYTIAVGGGMTTAQKQVMQYMATYGGGLAWSISNTDTIETEMQKLLCPSTVSITDRLSKYVRYYSDKPDLKVTMKPRTGTGTETILYNNGITNSGKDKIQSVTYTAGDTEEVPTDSTGTVSAIFKESYHLDPGYIYTLSFNVKTTQAAYEEYEVTGFRSTGDIGTDYPGNETSASKPGFYSNTEAKATYKIGETAVDVYYDHPVVQVTDETLLDIEVTKLWDETITDDNKKEVTVKLYSAIGDGKDLTQVMDQSESPQPVVLTLNAGNGWKATAKGLPLTDKDGHELSYYIIEDVPEGFLAVYHNPVFEMTINHAGSFAAGKVAIPEISSSGIYSGTATVQNNPRLLLPDTGGGGDALYANLGTVLLTLGFLLLLRKGRGDPYDLRKGRTE